MIIFKMTEAAIRARIILSFFIYFVARIIKPIINLNIYLI